MDARLFTKNVQMWKDQEWGKRKKEVRKEGKKDKEK